MLRHGPRVPGIEWGAATSTLQGQERSGDVHLVLAVPTGAFLAVVDGIGHGNEAADAAQLAAATLTRYAEGGVIPAVRRCHEALIGTRGAVLSVVSISMQDDTLTWLGVGNVSGTFVRADPRSTPRVEELLARGGVLGAHLPPLQAAVISIVPGDVVALATDGVRPGLAEVLMHRLPPQRLAAKVLDEQARGTDDALALVARYLGRPVSAQTRDGAP